MFSFVEYSLPIGIIESCERCVLLDMDFKVDQNWFGFLVFISSSILLSL